ncbi:hypothetical protein B0T39_20235 [Chromobacterium haemolyticum]|nr:hypothetical protein B0T39_20235 [Chromobacterium haemolyticum]
MILVRKISRKNHEEQASGSWKVAFADFTLALMALFMVLWLTQASTRSELREIQAAVSGMPFHEGGTGPFEMNSKRPSLAEKDRAERNSRSQLEAASSEQERLRRMQKDLAQQVMQKAKALDMQQNVSVEATPDGLRIRIQDTQDKGMFERGSDVMNPPFHTLLSGIVATIVDEPGKVMITGHTDAVEYNAPSVFDNNLALASRRALRVRQVMLADGMPTQQIEQVVGMGDNQLIQPEDPHHARNRRVELLLRSPSGKP